MSAYVGRMREPVRGPVIAALIKVKGTPQFSQL